MSDAVRPDAMRLLAEGCTLSFVARELRCSRTTVRHWRDSPEGERELSAARKAREGELTRAIEDTRRILRENARRAGYVLVDKLGSSNPFEAVAAARDLLDRVGLVRTTRVDTTGSGLDFSKLSDEEFEAYERLHAKAAGRDEPPPPATDEPKP